MSSGYVVTNFEENVRFIASVVIGPDGSIYVAGSGFALDGSKILLSKYSATNGFLDASFGDQGLVSLVLEQNATYTAESLFLLSNRILFSGVFDNSGYIAALTFNGTFDSSFGEGAPLNGEGSFIASDDLALSSTQFALSGQSIAVNGTIYVSVLLEKPKDPPLLFDPAPIYEYGIIAYSFNGASIQAFGGVDKIATYGEEGKSAVIKEVLVQQYTIEVNGTPTEITKVLAVGSVLDFINNPTTIVRFDNLGAIDNSFGGGDGVASLDLGMINSELSAITLADNSILLAGSGSDFENGRPNDDFILAKLTDQGALDTSFGSGGVVITDFGASEIATQIKVLDDGSILVAGVYYEGGRLEYDDALAVAKYLPNGALDTTFGNGGKAIINIPFDFVLKDFTIQDDGKIVFSGLAEQQISDTQGIIVDDKHFVLIRLNQDGSLDTSFDGQNNAPVLNDNMVRNAAALINESGVVQGTINDLTKGYTGNIGTIDFDLPPRIGAYDPDGTAPNLIGIAVTKFALGTTGTFEYSLDSGNTWIVDTLIDQLTTGDAVVFASDTLFRYTPEEGATGYPGITFHAWDSTGGFNTGDVVNLALTGTGSFSPFSQKTATYSFVEFSFNEKTGTSNADNLGPDLGYNTGYILRGLGGNDILRGTEFNDILDGGTGADRMTGGDGDDEYFVDNVADTVIEFGGVSVGGFDTIYSSVSYKLPAGVETIVLTGNANINATGNDGFNTLIGNDGNNILDGKFLADTMSGGKGDDTYFLNQSDDIVIEMVNEGIDTVIMSGGSYTLPDNVENGTLVNLGGILVGNDLDNRLNGVGSGSTLVGGLGNDTLENNAGTLIGGLGDDIYVTRDAVVINILEEFDEGTDTVISSISFDLSLRGANVENLTLSNGTVNGGTTALNGTGNELDNTITGNAGANILNGGLGEDTLIGGLGNDTYLIDNANDVVIEGVNAGIDTIRSAISYDLSVNGANVENLTLTDGTLNGGTANINGFGNALNNVITGNAGNNILDGIGGKDTLIGGLGNDEYVVDLIQTGTSASTFRVALEDTVTEAANAGVDLLTLIGDFEHQNATTLTLGANLENLDAQFTATTKLNLTGNTLNNVLTGNDADNILLGAAGNDTLIGGVGNDTLDGGVGVDTLIGGTGNDTYLVDIIPTLTNVAPIVINGATLQDSIDEENGTADGVDTLKLRGSVVIPTATAATNIALTDALASIENLDITLTGTTRLNLTGNDADNILIGNAAVNTLNGGLGNDTLDGKAGADIMEGGLGDDTYVVDNLNDQITELVDEGTDTIISSISFDLSLRGANVENLTLSNGTTNGGTTAINGTGNAQNNTITGNAGANILDGGLGADTLIGGLGNDTYIVDNVNDEVIESLNAGIDLVRSSIDYTLTDHVENLTLTDGTLNGGTVNLNGTGNALNNVITGNAGDNILDGGAGIDSLLGGLGNDRYIVDLVQTGTTAATFRVALQDRVTEGLNAGTDTLELRGNFDHLNATTLTLGANLENLDASETGTTKVNLTGNTLNNVLTGNDADNILLGAAGNDTLIGGVGNDTLDGGVGVDTLIGGTGNDTYVVDMTVTGTGNATAFTIQDSITELADEGTDTLRLRGTLGYTTAKTLLVDEIAALTGQSIEGLDVSLTGSAKINITGNSADNVLVGNAFTNTLIGDAGDDILDGKAGADTMIGGAGDDTYFVDVIKPATTSGGDVIIEDNLALNFGNDTVNTTFSANLNSSQFDGIENLTLLGTAALNATGDDGDNELIGNVAANIINGGAGADEMDGGKGNDIYIVDDLGDDVSELYTAAQGGGIDLVRSSVTFELDDNIENLTLTGTADIDATGNELANTIIGNSGDNLIDGEDGADRMTGGDGNDTYFVDNIGDIVTETNANALIGGIDTVNSEISYTLGANLENLTLIDDEDINGTGNSLRNIIVGNAGNNVLDGGASATIVDTLIGGTGNDTYVVDMTVTGTGNATAFTIQDSITELADEGTDTLRLRGTLGYTTAKTLLVDEIAALTGQSIEGLDVSLTGSAKINITGNSADNVLVGNAFTNTLIGDAGDDILDGKAGADTLDGGAGDDTYFVDVIKPANTSGGDVIIEDNLALNFGNDTVNTTFSANLNSSQFDGIENLTLLGTAALNATGDDGDNELIGNVAANIINGGAGEDEIIGGAGNDTLTGGLGADTFVWELADKGANGRPAIDRVTDFNINEDVLDLRDLLDGESVGSILNYIDISNSTTSGVTNTEIRISSNGGFTSGTFAASAENQHITLAGVNLLSGTNEADLLNNLITQNKLLIDG